MTNLTPYTNPRSRGSIARWMMEEAGQPYAAINPMKKARTPARAAAALAEA